MAEVDAEVTYVRLQKQKIALVLAAMPAFAKDLGAKGLAVDYVRLDNKRNSHSIVGELNQAIARHKPQRIAITAPGEHRLLKALETFAADSPAPVDILVDDRFFTLPEAFAYWARGRKGLRLEHFYRQMRRKTGLLMTGNKPAGGAWNFDQASRKPLPREHKPTPSPTGSHDHFGVLDNLA
jgi:deoxyribodipyrimidine photolyase-related protein